MALSDQHWKKILEALRYKAAEAGTNLTDFGVLETLLQENWELLNVERNLDVYIKAQKIPELETQKAAHEAAAVDLDQQIKDLKAAVIGP